MKTRRGLVIELKEAALPRSLAGSACDYAFSQRTRLEVFLSNGIVEIDNNWTENAIRPVVVGRKNWLHFGSKEAGPNIAAILSIFETCHRLGINVREYLLDVLPKLANGTNREVAALTPAARLEAAEWREARRLPLADFEDAVVATVARVTASAFVIMRNASDFAGSPVPAIAPEDFLSQLTAAT